MIIIVLGKLAGLDFKYRQMPILTSLKFFRVMADIIIMIITIVVRFED